MSFRLTREEAARKRELASRLRTLAGAAQAAGERLEKALAEALGPVNAAVRAYNVAADEARAFAEEVADRLRDEIEEKSERWREGDAGQAAEGMTEEWEGIDLSDMDMVRLVQPDTLQDAAASADRLDELPEEPS